jgi:hypothetical protein
MMVGGPVLVGTDLSPAAEEVLGQGAELSDSLRNTLHVYHVIPGLFPDSALFAEFPRAHRQVEHSVLGKAR